MKRFVTIMLMALLPALTWGQIQLTTRKYKLSDFPEKTTKVVLTGNMFYDSALKEEISDRWRLSPYEFCTLEDFEKIKTSKDYYFLLTTKGQFRKESTPGIDFLSLVKGGDNAVKGIKHMLEVVSVPLCSADYPSGREYTFLPALLDIMQHHTLLAMQNDRNAYFGLNNSIKYMSSETRKGTRICFSQTDISASVNQDLLKSAEKHCDIIPEEEADKLLDQSASKTLISYVVAPYNPQKGSYCYKMVINTENKTLFYYKRHRIKDASEIGFLSNDIKRVIELLQKVK